MTLNDIVQIATVAIILVVAVVWVIRRIMRKRDCESGCDGCPLTSNCKTRKPKK